MSIAMELYAKAKELSNAEASGIKQKTGTTIRTIQYVVVAGKEAIEKLQQEAKSKIDANNERYSKKVAEEYNLPIINELNDNVKAYKDNTSKIFNNSIDARITQANKARAIPVRDSSFKLLRDIKTLIDTGADISESDWKQWGEQFAGHYMEEKQLSALAKTKGIDILPVSDPDRSIENLETFRQMGNIAINVLDNPNDSILALSFLKAGGELAKLMDDIDTDLTSIIPAERISVLDRLKQAKETAYDKNNIPLVIKIRTFMNDYIKELSTPEELKDAVYEQAEELIQESNNAKKE